MENEIRWNLRDRAIFYYRKRWSFASGSFFAGIFSAWKFIIPSPILNIQYKLYELNGPRNPLRLNSCIPEVLDTVKIL